MSKTVKGVMDKVNFSKCNGRSILRRSCKPHRCLDFSLTYS